MTWTKWLTLSTGESNNKKLPMKVKPYVIQRPSTMVLVPWTLHHSANIGGSKGSNKIEHYFFSAHTHTHTHTQSKGEGSLSIVWKWSMQSCSCKSYHCGNHVTRGPVNINRKWGVFSDGCTCRLVLQEQGGGLSIHKGGLSLMREWSVSWGCYLP